MKNAYFFSFYLLVTILMIDQYHFSFFNHASKKLDPTQREINTLIRENSKLKKNITAQTDQIRDLDDHIKNLKEENQHLNYKLDKKTSDIKQASDKITVLSKDIKSKGGPELKAAMLDINSMMRQLTQYHGFYEQMKMQMMRQRELKTSLDDKVKEVIISENKINNLYHSIENQFKPGLSDISKKVSFLEKSNYSLNQRLFLIEKDQIKEDLINKMHDTGIEIHDKDNEIYKETQGADCNNRNSCKVCASDPKCVWCSLEQKCTLGNASGPADNSCTMSFEYGSCSQSSCNFLSTCSQCIQHDNCGWCSSSNKCSVGNLYRPLKDFCKKSYIHKNNHIKCIYQEQNKFGLSIYKSNRK